MVTKKRLDAHLLCLPHWEILGLYIYMSMQLVQAMAAPAN